MLIILERPPIESVSNNLELNNLVYMRAILVSIFEASIYSCSKGWGDEGLNPRLSCNEQNPNMPSVLHIWHVFIGSSPL